MSNNEKVVSYYCDICNIHKKLVFNRKLYEYFKRPNGLAIFTDTHKCKGGIMGVYNLDIDHDLNIRSFNRIELPEYKKQLNTIIPIPSAPDSSNDDNIIIITYINEINDINVLIDDRLLDIKIQIGKIDELDPITTLVSELGLISIKIYPANTRYTKELESWMNNLINIIEILVPTKIGFFIEAIKYILDETDHYPTDFDISMIKTILASHEIYVSLKDNKYNIQKIFKKLQLDEEDRELMQNIIENIKKYPNTSIQDFVKYYNKDIVHQIYLYLILEKNNIINIERPGIVEYN